MPRIDWLPVIEEDAAIVRAYDTPATLRHVFYRLVAAGHIPNTQTAYKTLSARTTAARRAGNWPTLTDHLRTN